MSEWKNRKIKKERKRERRTFSKKRDTFSNMDKKKIKNNT